MKKIKPNYTVAFAVFALFLGLQTQAQVVQNFNLAFSRNQFQLVDPNLDLHKVNLLPLIVQAQGRMLMNQRVSLLALNLQVGAGFPQLSLQTRASGNYFGNVVALENTGESFGGEYLGSKESQNLQIRVQDPLPTEAFEMYVMGLSAVRVLALTVTIETMNQQQVAEARLRASMSWQQAGNLASNSGVMSLQPGPDAIIEELGVGQPAGTVTRPQPAPQPNSNVQPPVVRPTPQQPAQPPVVRPTPSAPPPVVTGDILYVKSCERENQRVGVKVGDFISYETNIGSVRSVTISRVDMANQRVVFRVRGPNNNLVENSLSVEEVCKW